MKHDIIPDVHFFFATAPLPCPYFTDRVERRVVTEIVGRNADAHHSALSLAGFRRSHEIAYAPACPGCSECTAVRIPVQDFNRGKSMDRIWRQNKDITTESLLPVGLSEHYELFSRYQAQRHGNGEMSKMTFPDYQSLVEDTPVDSNVIEFRDGSDNLVGVCLTDRVETGLSAVYSFFDPSLARRSLGTYMILWLIEKVRSENQDYVFLGYWIRNCTKMSYKSRFKPLEFFSSDGWSRQEPLSRPY